MQTTMDFLRDVMKGNVRYHDLLKNPIGIISIAIIVIATWYVVRCLPALVPYQWTFTTVPSKRTYDDPKDREAQENARKAAEQRQKMWKSKQAIKKRSMLISFNNPPIDSGNNKRNHEVIVRKKNVNLATNTSMSMEEIIASSLPVFDDGYIIFRSMFQLSDADQTAATLRRLAQEFIPIIRQRQYNVTSVSEFCCCGDGMDYQLGGKSLSVRPGERVAGHESERVMGYNRVVLPNGNTLHGTQQRFNIDTEKYTSSIHLRLRSPNNHALLISYEQVCEHMCHELAHCIYHDHSPEFYSLMRDIQQQHRDKCR